MGWGIAIKLLDKAGKALKGAPKKPGKPAPPKPIADRVTRIRARRVLEKARAAFRNGKIGSALRAAKAIFKSVKRREVRRAIGLALGRARLKFGRRKGARQLCNMFDRIITSKNMRYSEKQLKGKFNDKRKHAKDFGVNGNSNPANWRRWQEAMERHVTKPATQPINGSYRGNPVTHFVDPRTRLNVMRDRNGNFLSGYRLNKEQLERVLKTGKLGGG